MRAITLRQPWAGAVLIDGKDVENRQSNILGAHRGLVAIHAGKEFDHGNGAGPTLKRITGREYLDPAHIDKGAVVGVVSVFGWHRVRPGCCTSPWAQPDAGVHIVLGGPVRLPDPVPCRGFLGLWTVPDGVADRVRVELERARAETGGDR